MYFRSSLILIFQSQILVSSGITELEKEWVYLHMYLLN